MTATAHLAGRLLWAGCALLASTAAYYIYRGYTVRRSVRSLALQGIPLAKHSWLWGHLPILGELMGQLPGDAHGDYVSLLLRRNWRTLFPTLSSCPPVVYLDTWPFAPPLMVSMTIHTSAQFTQEHSLTKAEGQNRLFYPMSLGRDVSCMEGAEWKLWRRRMNPAFGVANVLARLPDVLDEVETFVGLLRAKAGRGGDDDGAWGPVVLLDVMARKLAIDVVWRFVFDMPTHEQTGQPSRLSIATAAVLDQVSRLMLDPTILNAYAYWSPWRHFKIWRNLAIFRQELTPLIEERLRAEAPGKTLVDVLVQSVAEEQHKAGKSPLPLADPRSSERRTFMDIVIANIPVFVFAGHDSTAASICCLLHMLEEHPAAIARVRDEITSVLGSGPAAALRANPHLINSLVYLHAVVKEAMRLEANVSTIRRGEPGFFLAGEPSSEYERVRFPTEGWTVLDGVWGINSDERVFARPDKFLPERWLATDEDDPLYPPRHAWRFFAMGLRNCIGQQLAMLEMKLVVVLLLREMDIECAWDEWDRMRAGRSGAASAVAPDMAWGKRFYQVGSNTPPRIKDDMPVHVRLRTRT
jgi:cytochrome P450